MDCSCGHFGCHTGFSVGIAGSALLSFGITNGMSGGDGPRADRKASNVVGGVCCTAPFSDPNVMSKGFVAATASCDSRELPFAKNGNVTCCNTNFSEIDGGGLATSLVLSRGLSFVAGKLSIGLGNSCGDNFMIAGANANNTMTACAPILRRSKDLTCHGTNRGASMDCSCDANGSHS